MKLNYKASTVAKAERENNCSLFTTIANLGEDINMSDLMFLLQAGGCTADEADALVADQGIDGCVEVIMVGLAESGFLGKKVNADDIKRSMEQTRTQSSITTGNTGSTKKA